MEKKSVFSAFLNWLNTTEMFARPAKQLSGKWQLFEYYVEKESDLNNVTEAQLKADKEYWNIEFTTEEMFLTQSNLSVSLISSIENGNWSISKNFVTLIDSENFRNNVEFQFAIEKKNLKLLKKDGFGKIEFFGFFRMQNTT
jgi:hypothetical protein